MKGIGFEIKEIHDLLLRNITKEAHLENGCVVTPAQAKIATFLEHNNDKKIYQKDIEGFLNSKRSTVSGILDTMEKNNLINRISDLSDLRLKQIVLTDYAKGKIKKIRNKIRNINCNLEKGISKHDLEIFFKVMEKMKHNIYNEED